MSLYPKTRWIETAFNNNTSCIPCIYNNWFVCSGQFIFLLYEESVLKSWSFDGSCMALALVFTYSIFLILVSNVCKCWPCIDINVEYNTKVYCCSNTWKNVATCVNNICSQCKQQRTSGPKLYSLLNSERLMCPKSLRRDFATRSPNFERELLGLVPTHVQLIDPLSFSKYTASLLTAWSLNDITQQLLQLIRFFRYGASKPKID